MQFSALWDSLPYSSPSTPDCSGAPLGGERFQGVRRTGVPSFRRCSAEPLHYRVRGREPLKKSVASQIIVGLSYTLSHSTHEKWVLHRSHKNCMRNSVQACKADRKRSLKLLILRKSESNGFTRNSSSRFFFFFSERSWNGLEGKALYLT